jgi:hypothetical protein
VNASQPERRRRNVTDRPTHLKLVPPIQVAATPARAASSLPENVVDLCDWAEKTITTGSPRTCGFARGLSRCGNFGKACSPT